MRVLIEVKPEKQEKVRVVVRLHTKKLRREFLALLSEERREEAFDLAYRKAMMDAYVPPGSMPAVLPDFFLAQGDF